MFKFLTAQIFDLLDLESLLGTHDLLVHPTPVHYLNCHIVVRHIFYRNVALLVQLTLAFIRAWFIFKISRVKLFAFRW